MVFKKPNINNLTFILIASLIVTLAALWSKSTTYDTAVKLKTDIGIAATEEDNESSPEDNYLFGAGQNINILLLGLDTNGLSDLIMLLSYNQKENNIYIISIPRDTFVSQQNWADDSLAFSHLAFAHYVGFSENEDYHLGALNTAGWVEHLFDIPIHEYISLNYRGFIELVDHLGGVEINVDPAFEDLELKLGSDFDNKTIKLSSGLQVLSGEETLAYARYRGRENGDRARIEEPGSSSPDGDRMRRNQRLTKALYNQVRALTFREILETIEFMPKIIQTSIDLWDIGALAPTLYRLEIDKMVTLTLPGEPGEIYLEEVKKEVHYYFLDFDRSKELLKEAGIKN